MAKTKKKAMDRKAIMSKEVREVLGRKHLDTLRRLHFRAQVHRDNLEDMAVEVESCQGSTERGLKEVSSLIPGLSGEVAGKLSDAWDAFMEAANILQDVEDVLAEVIAAKGGE